MNLYRRIYSESREKRQGGERILVKAYREGDAGWRFWGIFKSPEKPATRISAEGAVARGVFSGSASESASRMTNDNAAEKGPPSAAWASAAVIAPLLIGATVKTAAVIMMQSQPVFMMGNLSVH